MANRVRILESLNKPSGRVLVTGVGYKVQVVQPGTTTAVTVYQAATGGSTWSWFGTDPNQATGTGDVVPFTADPATTGTPVAGGEMWVDEQRLELRVLTLAGVEVLRRPLELASVATLKSVESEFVQNTEDWYGTWRTIGNTPGSIGFAGTPTVAPATTITSGVTFPLSNTTVPVAETSVLSATGGSFTLGGKIVVYSGRSAASGAGNATGCYSLSTETGTVASGTALGFTSIGFGALAIYEKFGEANPNRPIPGSTQAAFLLANYYGPTVDDSAEGFSTFVGVKDTGTPFAQHKPITGFEGIAQIEGGNTALDGYTAPLLATASRTNVVGATTHVKNVIGHKLSHNASGGPPYGFSDQYDGLYQGASALSSYTTLNGAATLPQATIPVASGAAMPPATVANPVTVLIGPNADGVGGQQVTYTGISTNDLTGCTGGTGTIATGSRVTNIVRGVNVKDPLAFTSGFLLGDTGWSASLIAALRGGTDGDLAMFALTGPTNAEVAGGLTLVRLNAGSGQTKSILKMYDTSGTNRMSLSVAGDWIASGRKFIGQQAGVTTCQLDGSTGALTLGISTGVGGKLYSGSGAPGTLSGQANGDVYFRTDGGAGTTIYQLRAGTWTATGA